MINSTYVPKRFEDLNSDSCMVNAQGASGTVTAKSAGNIDLKLNDDHILTGLMIAATNSVFGDTATMQIVDKDSVIPTAFGAAWSTYQPVLYPNYPILRQFVTNWGVHSDTQMKINQTGLYPAKVIAGLYLRLIYASSSTANLDVLVLVNYELHMVLK